jgi:hypothetical protein
MFRMNGMPRAQDAQERRLSVLHSESMNGMPRAQDAQERRLSVLHGESMSGTSL